MRLGAIKNLYSLSLGGGGNRINPTLYINFFWKTSCEFISSIFFLKKCAGFLYVADVQEGLPLGDEHFFNQTSAMTALTDFFHRVEITPPP